MPNPIIESARPTPAPHIANSSPEIAPLEQEGPPLAIPRTAQPAVGIRLPLMPADAPREQGPFPAQRPQWDQMRAFKVGNPPPVAMPPDRFDESVRQLRGAMESGNEQQVGESLAVLIGQAKHGGITSAQLETALRGGDDQRRTAVLHQAIKRGHVGVIRQFQQAVLNIPDHIFDRQSKTSVMEASFETEDGQLTTMMADLAVDCPPAEYLPSRVLAVYTHVRGLMNGASALAFEGPVSNPHVRVFELLARSNTVTYSEISRDAGNCGFAAAIVLGILFSDAEQDFKDRALRRVKLGFFAGPYGIEKLKSILVEHHLPWLVTSVDAAWTPHEMLAGNRLVRALQCEAQNCREAGLRAERVVWQRDRPVVVCSAHRAIPGLEPTMNQAMDHFRPPTVDRMFNYYLPADQVTQVPGGLAGAHWCAVS